MKLMKTVLAGWIGLATFWSLAATSSQTPLMYFYGKNMGLTAKSKVTLVAVKDGAKSYQWQVSDKKSSGYTDLPRATGKEYTFVPEEGRYYRCRIDGTGTKGLRLVTAAGRASAGEWTFSKAPYESGRWYLTDNVTAYWSGTYEGTPAFDVHGYYEYKNRPYMIGTSYNTVWYMGESDPIEYFAPYFDDGGVVFLAKLGENSTKFQFDCDTMLADYNITDYSDSAALIGQMGRDGKLKQVAMIGARSEAEAKDTDPAFTVAPMVEGGDFYYWIGYYSSRRNYEFNYQPPSDNYIVNEDGVVTAVLGTDSGMALSWKNLSPGSTVKFLFKAGSVADIGAVDSPINFFGRGGHQIGVIAETNVAYRLENMSTSSVASNNCWFVRDAEGQLWRQPAANLPLEKVEGNLYDTPEYGVVPSVGGLVFYTQTNGTQLAMGDVVRVFQKVYKGAWVDGLQAANDSEAAYIRTSTIDSDCELLARIFSGEGSNPSVVTNGYLEYATVDDKNAVTLNNDDMTYTVKLLADIIGTVELKATMGKILLDLNGHTITGGVTGGGGEPSETDEDGNGQPAIVVKAPTMSGEKDAKLELVITNSAAEGDVYIRGTSGADEVLGEHLAGCGGAAIVFEEGANGTVTIGSRVHVLGGDGGSAVPGTGHPGGDAGHAVDGAVQRNDGELVGGLGGDGAATEEEGVDGGDGGSGGSAATGTILDDTSTGAAKGGAGGDAGDSKYARGGTGGSGGDGDLPGGGAGAGANSGFEIPYGQRGSGERDKNGIIWIDVWVDAASRTYDGTRDAELGNVEATGMQPGDDVQVLGLETLTKGKAVSKDAGENVEVYAAFEGVSLAGADANKYRLNLKPIYMTIHPIEVPIRYREYSVREGSVIPDAPDAWFDFDETKFVAGESFESEFGKPSEGLLFTSVYDDPLPVPGEPLVAGRYHFQADESYITQPNYILVFKNESAKLIVSYVVPEDPEVPVPPPVEEPDLYFGETGDTGAVYTVKFVTTATGGVDHVSNPTQLFHGGDAVVLPTSEHMTSDTQIFVGWYADPYFNQGPITSFDGAYGDVRVFAKWRSAYAFIDLRGGNCDGEPFLDFEPDYGYAMPSIGEVCKPDYPKNTSGYHLEGIYAKEEDGTLTPYYVGNPNRYLWNCDYPLNMTNGQYFIWNRTKDTTLYAKWVWHGEPADDPGLPLAVAIATGNARVTTEPAGVSFPEFSVGITKSDGTGLDPDAKLGDFSVAVSNGTFQLTAELLAMLPAGTVTYIKNEQIVAEAGVDYGEMKFYPTDGITNSVLQAFLRGIQFTPLAGETEMLIAFDTFDPNSHAEQRVFVEVPEPSPYPVADIGIFPAEEQNPGVYRLRLVMNEFGTGGGTLDGSEDVYVTTYTGGSFVELPGANRIAHPVATWPRWEGGDGFKHYVEFGGWMYKVGGVRYDGPIGSFTNTFSDLTLYANWKYGECIDVYLTLPEIDHATVSVSTNGVEVAPEADGRYIVKGGDNGLVIKYTADAGCLINGRSSYVVPLDALYVDDESGDITFLEEDAPRGLTEFRYLELALYDNLRASEYNERVLTIDYEEAVVPFDSDGDTEYFTVVKLNKDITAVPSDTYIWVESVCCRLDLNGHKIDRALTAPTQDGCVFAFSDYAEAIIMNSGNRDTAMITGGWNSSPNNYSDWRAGGGINASYSSKILIKGVSIKGNKSVCGGGFYIDDDAQVYLDDGASVEDNVAETGGAFCFGENDDYENICQVANSFVRGNVATNGAVVARDQTSYGGGDFCIVGSSFTGNSSPDGSIFASGSGVTVYLGGELTIIGNTNSTESVACDFPPKTGVLVEDMITAEGYDYVPSEVERPFYEAAPLSGEIAIAGKPGDFVLQQGTSTVSRLSVFRADNPELVVRPTYQANRMILAYPTVTVTVPSVEHATYAVLCNGEDVTDQADDGVYTFDGGSSCVEVRYTPEEGYYISGPAETSFKDVCESQEFTEKQTPVSIKYATVRLVSAQQQYPWNGKVNLTFDLADVEEQKKYNLLIETTVGGETKSIVEKLGKTTSGRYTRAVDIGSLYPDGTVDPESDITVYLQETKAQSAGGDTGPLCFTALEPGMRFGMMDYKSLMMMMMMGPGVPSVEPSRDLNLEYSLDGESWQPVVFDSQDLPIAPGMSLSLKMFMVDLPNVGDRIYLRGDNPDGINEMDFIEAMLGGDDLSAVGSMWMMMMEGMDGGQYAVSGNIMSLIDPAGETTEIPCEGCFAMLFGGMMEATAGMVSAPSLPATELKPGCYAGLFTGARNLRSAPVLPAEKLEPWCYAMMFEECWMLRSVTMLATDIGTSEDMSMFEWLMGTAIVDFDGYEDESGLPASLLISPDADFDFPEYDLSVVGAPPGWTDPALPRNWSVGRASVSSCDAFCITTMEPNCIVGFVDYGLGDGDIPWEGNLEYSLDGENWTPCEMIDFFVPFYGVEVEHAGQKVYFRGDNPSGFNDPAESHAQLVVGAVCLEGDMHNAYISLSGNVMSLVDPTCQATEIPNDGCFAYLASGSFSSIISAGKLKLPATTLTAGCYDEMFVDQEYLIDAPELPAETLEPGSYFAMFAGCESLRCVTMLATDVSADSCCQWFLDEAAEYGRIVTNPEATWWQGPNAIVPDNWVALPLGSAPLLMASSSQPAPVLRSAAAPLSKTANPGVDEEAMEGVFTPPSSIDADLDFRSVRVLECAEGAPTEVLQYSATDWSAKEAGDTATITYTIGESTPFVFAVELVDDGALDWTPQANGETVFTMTSGEAVETATYVVNAIDHDPVVAVPDAPEGMTVVVSNLTDGAELAADVELPGGVGYSVAPGSKVGVYYVLDNGYSFAAETVASRTYEAVTEDVGVPLPGIVIAPEARLVSVAQHYPWDLGLDLTYDLFSIDTNKTYDLVATIVSGDQTNSVSVELGHTEDGLYRTMLDIRDAFPSNTVANDAAISLAVADKSSGMTPFCVTANEPNITVGFSNSACLELFGSTEPWTADLEYSYDGQTWTPCEGERFYDEIFYSVVIPNVGDKVYFRGNNPNGFSQVVDPFEDEGTFGGFLAMNSEGVPGAHVTLSGNIMSLVAGADYATATEIPGDSGCFFGLFYDFASDLIDESVHIAHFDSVENLLLPATELKDWCYGYLFANTGITASPVFPAKTLVPGCYAVMFTDCSELEEITLLATDVGSADDMAMLMMCSDSYGEACGVASVGVCYRDPEATWSVPAYSLDGPAVPAIPESWSLEPVPEEILARTRVSSLVGFKDVVWHPVSFDLTPVVELVGETAVGNLAHSISAWGCIDGAVTNAIDWLDFEGNSGALADGLAGEGVTAGSLPPFDGIYKLHHLVADLESVVTYVVSNCSVKIDVPAEPKGCSYVVSNLTDGVAIDIYRSDVGGMDTYRIPVGKDVGVYADPDDDYEVVGEPLLIQPVPAGYELEYDKLPYAKHRPVEVACVVWNEELKALVETNVVCEVLDEDTTELEEGVWYVALESMSIPNLVAGDGSHLVLLDNVELTVESVESERPGIEVAEGTSFTVVGQSGGTGSLKATGGEGAAGIGGAVSASAGSVTICGGMVEAIGGAGAAGIGGGDDGDGGSVTICGGTVEATGGESAAGIGGGNWGRGATVVVNGGKVSAQGGAGAAGIGGAEEGSGKSFTINGGTVEAIGGEGAAGIGGGEGGSSGGEVEINGGELAAQGGAGAAGIGGGKDGGGATVVVNDGKVEAVGGGEGEGCGPAFGKGKGGSGDGSLTVNPALALYKGTTPDVVVQTTVDDYLADPTPVLKMIPVLGTRWNPWEIGADPEHPEKVVAWTNGVDTFALPVRGLASVALLEMVCDAVGGANFTMKLVSAYGTSTNDLVMLFGDDSVPYDTLADVFAADPRPTTVKLFEVKGYWVSYDGNGAAGEMETDMFIPSVPTNLTANAFSAVGYEFLGWTTNGCEDVAYANMASGVDFAAPGETLALTAKWEDTGAEIATFDALTNALVAATNQAASLPVTVDLTGDVVVPQGGVITVYTGAGLPAVTFDGHGFAFDVSGIVPQYGKPVVVGEGLKPEDYQLFLTKGVSNPVYDPEGGKVILHARGESEDFPWILDDETGVTAWVDEALTNLAAVVIDNGMATETNAIDLVALTNNLATYGYDPALKPLDAFVKVVDGDATSYLKPVNWIGGAGVCATLGDALADGETVVIANFGTEKIPAVIAETGTGADGKTYAAVVENVPGEVERPIRAVRADGLLPLATGVCENVTLVVEATDEACIPEKEVESLAAANTNGVADVVGYVADYVDLSLYFGEEPQTEIGDAIAIHVPWVQDPRQVYRISRIHEGVAEQLPVGAENALGGEYVEFLGDEIVIHAKKFSLYAIGEITLQRRYTIIVGNGEKTLGEADPSYIATNFTVNVQGLDIEPEDIRGYCVRAKGEAPGSYAINFVCTRMPQGFDGEIVEIPGVFTISSEEDIVSKWAREDREAGYPENGLAHVRLGCDPTKGKVKGEKVYKAGKKASINATPAKGYVFAGWYEDPGFSKPVTWFVKGKKPNDWRTASQSFAVADNVYLFARFVEKTTTADPITWLRFEGAGYCGADASVLATNEVWYQGVQLPTNGCQIAFGSLSLPTVKVKGLPSGVKYDKVTQRFTGAPTACSTAKKPFFTVTVSVKNKAGATDVLVKNVRVVPLPKWTVGNFDGYHMEDGATNGTFAATVGKTGKVSGKTKGGWADTTFSAKNFANVTPVDGVLCYVADVTVSYRDPVTKKTVKQVDTLYLMEDRATHLGTIGGGDRDGCGAVGVQRAWDRKDLDFPPFDTKALKDPIQLGNGITLKFGAKGKVTIGGTVNGIRASGTTYVLPVAWRSTMTVNLFAQVPVYVAPTRNATGLCAVYDVKLTVGADGKFDTVSPVAEVP